MTRPTRDKRVGFRAVLSIGVFALFLFLSIARFVPSFRAWAAHHSMPFWLAAVLMGMVIVIFNVLTVYQLWTGKASTWDWDSPDRGYRGWVLRSQHPWNYWFRVALITAITCVFDSAIIAIAIQAVRNR